MELNQRISKFENKVWIILSVVLVVVVMSGLFVYQSLSGIVNDITEEARPDETILVMKEMLYDLSDAENNVKSYSLTGEAPYLDEYNQTVERVHKAIDQLRILTKDQPKSKNRVDSLAIFIDQKFLVLEDLLLLQGQSRVSSVLDKISNEIVAPDLVPETSSENAMNPIPEETVNAETEEKFFKKLMNKRKKTNEEAPEKIENETEESVESSSQNETYLSEIREEIRTVKIQEEQLDKSAREKELFLIQEDKRINDQIVRLYESMEADETLSMDEKLAIADSNSTQTKILIGVFCLLACVLLVFAGYAVNTYVKRNDAFKLALRKAKLETDQKNKEITDSITYAQKIQEAILPDQRTLKEYLKESFILYKPKDIVAGDFYWAVKIDQTVFCAVADCTGHGVPGAMVSVVCSTALNRCVQEFGLRKPSEILDKCRELVIETFAKGGNSVNDGMDIALIALEYEKEQVSISFSGANNGLYLVKNGLIQEVPADKQPIGNYQFQKAFTNHKLTLDKGDMIYLFSDGYADQFGGPYGKKFKYKPFQDLLTKNAAVDIQSQKRNLENTFETWRGNLEQIDDVCVIGVRV